MASIQFLIDHSRTLLLSSFVVVLLLLLKWLQSASSWILLACWPLGVVSFLYIARAYLAPYVLMRFSSHIRVRSVSLRSIRGLYFRKGNRTWQIDRFGYSYGSSADGKPKGLSFKVEGFKLEIEPPVVPPPPPPRARHRRGLTLADLSPSPLALYLWSVMSSVYSVIDPAVRPAIRLVVTSILQHVIHFIPRLTETVQLDIDRAVVLFTAAPQVQFVVENVVLKGHVCFTQNSQFHPTGGPDLPHGNQTLSARALAMGAWKSRLAKGFQRTWTRTWDHTLGQTTGSVAFDLVVQDVKGTKGNETFLRSPEPFTISGSGRFSPKDGAIEPGSVHSQVSVGVIQVDVDSLQTWLSYFKAPCTEDLPASPLKSSLSTATSPWIKSPFSATSMTSDVHVHFIAKRKKRSVKPLEFVSGAQFSLGSLILHKRVERYKYSVAVEDISCSCEPSDADANPTHRTWLGKQSSTSSSQAYSFSFAFQNFFIQRPNDMARGSFRVLSVGSSSVHAVISDWPALLPVKPSLCGDSTMPSVLLNVNVGSVSYTDRLDVLLQLASKADSPVPQGDPEPLLPSILSPVPRVVVSVNIGRFFTRVICADVTSVDEPFSLELETDGMIFNSSSNFRTGSVTAALRTPYGPNHEHLPLRMSVPFNGFLHPIFLRLRSSSGSKASRRMSRWGSESMNSETLFSMEAVEANGVLTALGEMNDDDDSACATLNTRSMFVDLHFRTEAALVELWDPKRLRILSALLALLSAHRPSSRPSPSPTQPRLPMGCAVSFSVAHMVLFVTGADINPDADPDITHGVAFSTGVSLRYCAVGMEQLNSFSFPQSHSQNRQKLYLPIDRLGDAAVLTRASEASGGSAAFGKVMLWNTTVRSAAADEFSMDDPLITERESPFLASKQLIAIKNIDADIKLTSRGPSKLNGLACDATFSINDSLLSFELGLVYSALLALRTIQTLQTCVAPSQLPSSHSRSPSSSTVTVHGSIKAIRVRLRLPGQTVVARFNHVQLASTPLETQCSINSLLVWVPVLPQRSLGEESEENWEELGRLHRCTLSLTPSLKGPIKVDSDSLRIRIPSGYAFADLQLAVAVTIKALKHLVHIAAAGKFTPMPSPEVEDAKLVPNITFSCRMLCVDVADDPFESQLGFNYRVGLAAAKTRLHREEAFDAKASAVVSGHSAAEGAPSVHTDYQFNSHHSVSIQEARWRLDMAHTLDWVLRHQQQRQERVAQEDSVYRELHGAIPLKRPTGAPDLVKVSKPPRVPPLLRLTFMGFRLHLDRPSFPMERLSTFLREQGSGLPHETTYSLLVPMHLNISLASVQISLRDYPLPLLYIPPRAAGHGSPSLLFDSDLVVAEEMGPPASVEWVPCLIGDTEESYAPSAPFTIHIPKTIMPVKTYARPSVSVLADQTTAFAWGVSYSPAIQDVVRVLESLTPETRDPSPHVGFWDKLRLIFHWTIQISFKEEVRLYIKGTRDPYVLEHDGAGFALCWQGGPQIKIGFPNESHEIVQVTSETMSIIIPKFDSQQSAGGTQAQGQLVSRSDCVKTCAKLSSGVRFGVGAAFERTCSGAECSKCNGSPFDRTCRFFNFRPHYGVQLVKRSISETQANHDSYRGFRSDFIHLSISLTSAVQPASPDCAPQPSSFHLTPKAFANFWSWWGLFDNGLSLPIKQGSYYPQKTISPKLSRHLATIKYRISVPQLFITHAYIDDTRESWVDGTTSFVGVKAKVDHFQADMHQRDEETVAPGKSPDSIQVVRHKPFYASEVVLKNVDLRAMQATFQEPLKQAVPISADLGNETKKKSPNSEIPPLWLDKDDFVETDWSPTQNYPEIQLLPVLSCPKLTYLKKNSLTPESHSELSKFGDEDTHTCLIGSEPTVPQVEICLAEQRVATLRRIAEGDLKSVGGDQSSSQKMMILLQDYVTHLKAVDQSREGVRMSNVESYYMPAEMVSADEWADFENVYQVHAPNLFMCNAVRDVLMQYYNCSRARRGYEYHMATRAVKFIRDQAEAMVSRVTEEGIEKSKASGGAAQAAASALRRMLTRDRNGTSLDTQADVSSDPANVDPLDGWEDGVILRKRHFCLLLKPQIILRTADPSSDIGTESTVILAAVQAKLQAFKIMDISNLEDPISGSIMTRNYMSLDGLQTFCPTDADSYGSGSVPLEVLIDYRCESDAFDRIVPQTNANCQYDRFNRLRLRNNITSTVRSSQEHHRKGRQAHLHNETDLIQVHVPRFTVSANDRHFQSISSIITHLILFSDVAHTARLEKLETLLFAYDFTDLNSAANVVSDLQSRLRSALETHNDVRRQVRDDRSQTKLEILKLKAHIFLLVEELNLIFDAIRLAQNRIDDRTDQKSALLLQASSSEISWKMLDEHRDLLAKLAVRNIDFSWLSKQDSSTVNSLTVGDLQAFDGSPDAVWSEIVSKYEEPSNHPLFKRDLFLDADWTILAPVGGISIYEKFQLNFHPIRLQLDARLGQRIMEYVWPARRGRSQAKTHGTPHQTVEILPSSEQTAPRSSLDSSRLLQKPRTSLDSSRLAPGLRKLGASRSFTDLRSAAAESAKPSPTIAQQSSHRQHNPDLDLKEDSKPLRKSQREDRPGKDDAVEMKSRSSQKTFILVKISSLELLLSIIKAESFECRDARIRTHALEFRNQTWSFEELVDQFIPSDLTWKGWVRMAFHQPLVPVLPVARELFSKTKLIASKNAPQMDSRPTGNKKLTLRGKRTITDATIRETRPRRSSSSGGASGGLSPNKSLTGTILSDEPESVEQEPDSTERARHQGRKRLLSVFTRGKGAARSLPLSDLEHR